MAMQYRRLGRAGLKVSALSFGSWVTFGKQVDTAAAVKLMGQAYDAGINFFDNAEVYELGKSEIIMGEALKKLAWRRESYTVSSKVFWGHEDWEHPKPTMEGLSRKHVIEACHGALKRLQVDYLDLYFAHRPDPETPVLETVRAMSHLVDQGKVLYWGTSEWPAARITEAYEVAERYGLVAPSMEQPGYNMIHRSKVEVEYKPLYELHGLGTTIFSPLASGLLSGKYLGGIPEGSRLTLKGYEWLHEAVKPESRDTRVVKANVEMAKKLGIPPARLALAWCLKNPNVSTVILGASKPEQLAENLKALDDLALITDAVAKEIDEKIGPLHMDKQR